MQRINHNLKRGGFTLLEISLVLVILVVVSAIASPVFRGTLNHERMRKASESIAADWTKTRAIAMETGQAQLWVCQLGSGSFAAKSSATAVSESLGQMPGQSASGGGLTIDASELTGTLPSGLIISQARVSDANSIAMMMDDSLANESGTATMLFFPDGTCSYARLTITREDDDEKSMSVMINGMSGTVRIVQSSSAAGANQ